MTGQMLHSLVRAHVAMYGGGDYTTLLTFGSRLTGDGRSSVLRPALLRIIGLYCFSYFFFTDAVTTGGEVIFLTSGIINFSPTPKLQNYEFHRNPNHFYGLDMQVLGPFTKRSWHILVSGLCSLKKIIYIF